MITLRCLLLLLCPLSLGAAALPRASQIHVETGFTGGLIVHIGCGDGSLTTELCTGAHTIGHGLDTDPEHITAAQKRARSLGVHGKVSFGLLTGNTLPYTDNLVNLLVVESPGAIPRDEVLRVLAPRGVAYIRNDTSWTKTVKPKPEGIDEWTHHLHSYPKEPSKM